MHLIKEISARTAPSIAGKPAPTGAYRDQVWEPACRRWAAARPRFLKSETLNFRNIRKINKFNDLISWHDFRYLHSNHKNNSWRSP